MMAALSGGQLSTCHAKITAGGQICEMASRQLMIDHKSVDILQSNGKCMGGIYRMIEICRRGAGRRLAKPNLSVVAMATTHLQKPIPNADKDLELSIEGPDYFPSQQDLFLGAPFAVTGGHVMVPDAPGWGAEINPDWLDKAA